MSKIVNLLKLKDYITLTGTTLGLIAVLIVSLGGRGFVSWAFFLLAFTIGTDLLDGYIARKTGTVNEIGKQLDSLNDSLTFGIAPAVLMFEGFRRLSTSLEPYDYILFVGCVIFALCAILRLARFNISDAPGYTGVPTPLSALLIINIFYANYFFAIAEGGGVQDFAFPLFSYYTIPIIMIFLGWTNITTNLKFDEKDKKVYIFFIIFAPLCPIFGIIGLLNPSWIIAVIVSLVFFIFVFIIIIYIIIGLVKTQLNKGKIPK